MSGHPAVQQAQQQATSATEEAGRHLAEDMSEDKLAQLEAKRRLVREGESGSDNLDRPD